MVLICDSFMKSNLFLAMSSNQCLYMLWQPFYIQQQFSLLGAEFDTRAAFKVLSLAHNSCETMRAPNPELLFLIPSYWYCSAFSCLICYNIHKCIKFCLSKLDISSCCCFTLKVFNCVGDFYCEAATRGAIKSWELHKAEHIFYIFCIFQKIEVLQGIMKKEGVATVSC